MFDSSVIKRTGQWWKLILAFCGTLAGGVLTAIAFVEIKHPTQWIFAAIMLGDVFFALGSGIFVCLSIRCPSCGMRWVWEAIRAEPAGAWLALLLSHPTCPSCRDPEEDKATLT